MSGNDFLNKSVLRWRWKVDRDVADVISSGSWFHVWGPETENARLPIVDSLTAGTVRRLVTAERKARRPGRSATRTNGPKYRGAIPFMTLCHHDIGYINTCRHDLIHSYTHTLRRTSTKPTAHQTANDKLQACTACSRNGIPWELELL